MVFLPLLVVEEGAVVAADNPIRPFDTADRGGNKAVADGRTWDVDKADTSEDRACMDWHKDVRRVNTEAGDFRIHAEEGDEADNLAELHRGTWADNHTAEELRDEAEGLAEAFQAVAILVDHLPVPEVALLPSHY